MPRILGDDSVEGVVMKKDLWFVCLAVLLHGSIGLAQDRVRVGVPTIATRQGVSSIR
jgi:malate/lactate dehydrogenase